MKKEIITKLDNFITNNKLNFDDCDSGLNGNVVIVCGYALYIGADEDTILEAVFSINKNTDVISKVKKVYRFAKRAGYEKWWLTPDAAKTYIFDRE